MDTQIHSILHVDMDAFYAAIEQRDRPELRGRPVVVGAPPDRRGVVATCSYEARPFGIHSAMPSRTAGKLCPHAVFVAPRMERYEEVSRQVMAILHDYTPLVEPVSVDEAFLDVRGALRLWADAVALAHDLKQRIRTRLELTASVGVATNKYLAKVASDLQKPDGLTIVPATKPEMLAFLAPLPVTKIWGVGKRTEQVLARAGFQTIGDIQRATEPGLAAVVGTNAARDIWQLAHGQDDRPVATDWEEKSISAEETFDVDCADPDVLSQTLLELVERVGARLRQAGKLARTGQIKVRFGDFSTITRQRAFSAPTNTDRGLLRCARELYEREYVQRPVRLLGFGVANLVEPGAASRAAQPELFPEAGADRPAARDYHLDRAVDAVRERFGGDALKRGVWPRGEEE